MVADDCWRPVQHGKQLVKGCAAAMPCPASGRHTREASLAGKMHTYDRTHRTHSRIDKWGHHPTKVSNGWVVCSMSFAIIVHGFMLQCTLVVGCPCCVFVCRLFACFLQLPWVGQQVHAWNGALPLALRLLALCFTASASATP